MGQVGCFTLLGVFLIGFAFIISAIQGQSFSYPLDVIVLYLIALALFGCLLQLCVLLTGNLWMGIGLHLFAIEFPILVVTPSKGTLLQVEFAPLLSNVERFHTLVDIPEIGIFVLAIVILLIWAYRRKRPIDWQRCIPDRAEGEGA